MTPDHRFTDSDVQAVSDTLTALGAIGGANAIPRATVRAEMGISDRKLRQMVEAAPSLGISIASTTDGYRGKPATDGPRYKALGNSMAVPVVRWIGERMAAVAGIEAVA